MAATQGFGEVQERGSPMRTSMPSRSGYRCQRVKPGKRHAFAHRHQEAEEVYVVVSGSGQGEAR